MEIIGDYDKSSFNQVVKGTERKQYGRKSTEIDSIFRLLSFLIRMLSFNIRLLIKKRI